MAGETVLIVDDNETNLKLLRVLLSQAGYEVHTAIDAKSALALIPAVRPRLVLMDIQLPDMDGLAVTRRLRADPATRDIRVLAVTAYAMKGDKEKALAAGCDGYITKPINTRTLVPIVENTLRGEPEQEPGGDGSESEAPGEPAREGSRGEPDDRPLVLVVEDDPQMNRFLVATLSRRYRIASARDGREGLEQAEALRPDLILTDLAMPVMRGDELVAALRQRPDFDATPIVILTGHDDGQLRLGLLRGGAQDLLTKPCSVDEIEARVGNLVTMHRARALLQAELATRQADVEALAHEVAVRNRELRTAMESMRIAREQAERASALKTNFLQLVSHELRTPATVLQLTLERLLNGSTQRSPAEQAMLARTAGAASRLIGLVESLLEYSRLESHRVTVDVTDLDVGELCRDALDEVAALAEHKGIELRSRVPVDLPLLSGDERLVHAIVINLLGNAVKFTSEGWVELSVRHTGEDGDGLHVIEVADTGSGIEEKNLGRIFEPFCHLEPIQQKHTPGVGLGLALVKQIVAALGGRISVESEVGRGSRFTVSLPPCREASVQFDLAASQSAAAK